MDITQEQQEKITKLKLIGLAKKMAYEVAKEKYEQSQQIEKDTEEKALATFNKRHNTNFEMACEFVDNEADFSEFLRLQQDEYKALGIDNEFNKVYSYNFMRNYVKARKSYLMLGVEFLRLFGRGQEGSEIEKAINTYLPPKYEKELFALNDKLLGITAQV